MKLNKSILNKLIRKDIVELEPGDILYFNDKKTYWIYLGKDTEVTEPDKSVWTDNDKSKDGIVHVKTGLWTSTYMTKMQYDPSAMFKINDDIVFHFKFIESKSLASIINDIKSNNILYIKTLNAEELSALNAAYTLYYIKNK
jgi:hypothetical protein